MMNKDCLKLGQEVFEINNYGSIERGTITEIKTEHQDYIKVHYNAVVDINNKVITEAYGENYCKIENAFLTCKEAFDELRAREDREYNGYLEEIKTLKDLLEFPLHHSFTDEDGCMYGLIVKAYKQRTKEILGIEIEN